MGPGGTMFVEEDKGSGLGRDVADGRGMKILS